MGFEEAKIVSTVICAVGGIPYIIRAYQRKIDPQVTSWALWTFIAVALLLTYKDAGDDASLGVAVTSLINPFIILCILLSQHERWTKLELFDYGCIVGGIVALGLWAWFRTDKNLAAYALYLALVADLFAAVRTIQFVWTHPAKDRPGAWLIFGSGMAVSLLGVKDFHHVANWIYALYMFMGSTSTAIPLVRYRLKNQIPLKEWI